MKTTSSSIKVPNVIRVFFAFATLVVAMVVGSINVASAAGSSCAVPTTDLGKVTATANVQSGGNYRVWIHMKATTASANTVYFDANNDSTCFNAGGSSTVSTSWIWTNAYDGSSSNHMSVNIPSANAQYPVALYGNAQGVLVDSILLTTDTSCTPTGDGSNCNTVVAQPVITNFTANPTSVNSGSTSRLSWSATNADNCTVSSGGQSSGTKSSTDSYTTGALTASTQFTLSCTNTAGGTSAPAQTTVTVTPQTGGTGTGNTASPSVAITDPEDGAPVSGTASLTASATVSGSTISEVVFTIGATTLTATTGTGSSYTVQWDTTQVADGQYTVLATAYAANGKTSSSSVMVTVQNSNLDVPAAPTGLQIDKTLNGDSYSVTLTWSVSDGATGYYVVSDGRTVNATPITDTSYADTVPADGATHQYTVIAANAAGNSDQSDPASFDATPSDSSSSGGSDNSGSGGTGQSDSSIPPVTDLAASTMGSNIVLSWSAPDPSIAYYDIYRSEGDGNTDNLQYYQSTTDTSFEDSTVDPDTTYNYFVLALHSDDSYSNPSNTVSASVSSGSGDTTGGTGTTGNNGNGGSGSNGTGTGNSNPDPGAGTSQGRGRGVYVGTIVDANGNPIPGASVVFNIGGRQHTYTANSSGQFTMPGLGKGSYSIHISAPGYNGSTQSFQSSNGKGSIHQTSKISRNSVGNSSYFNHWDFWNYISRGR